MGQRQSYSRPSKNLELIIHGVVYDVSGFVKKHPGGSIIYESINPDGTGFPADATIAFEQLHGHSKAPMEWLKKLRLEGKSRSLTSEEIALIKKEIPYDAGLSKSFKKATNELTEMGMFDYSVSHLLYRNFELFAILFTGSWLAIQGPAWQWWLGAAFGGCGWYQHECNHGSVSKNQTLNNILGSFWFGFGEAGSAQWWKREHNRHHADPQRHGADIDMDTLPLAFDSITAKNGNKTLLSMQHYTYQVATWLLVHFWQLVVHPKFILTRGHWMDLSFLVLHWSVFLGFFVPKIGWQSALLLHAAASAVEGSLLFTNFALSHTSMPYLENHLREHWVERSLRRTVDIHSHSSKFGGILGPVIDASVDFIMGYLNYQVIHHLWPLMPQVNQRDPRVHAKVEQIIRENPGARLKYNVTTYDVALYDMYANLSGIATDIGMGKDMDAVHPKGPEWAKTVSPTTKMGVANAAE